MPGGRIDILVEPDLRGFPGKLQSGLQASTGVAAGIGRGLGLAIAGGLAVAGAGFAQVIKIGNEYQGTLNEIQAVSGATGDTMAKVASHAKALGSDLTLSGVSAADAAGAMLELAKGGLTVDEAMTAAKGTLQLAGAAQIDGARAAEIQAQALNQFGLEASAAGTVADTLANTANAASGSIEDIALAMKYVGPVASSMSVSMEDTAATIGLLANNGIMADTAGTSLRGMLASLAAPSKEARGAIAELGIQAFDSQGRFVGFRSVIEQLTAAQGRMTDEQFASAAATAFGREPLAAITALAREGAPAFDELRAAVGRQGGAAEVAAAKMKGLGGAMESFRSNLETVAISVYELIDGPLEQLVRAGTEGLSSLNEGLSGIGSGNIGSGLAAGIAVATELFDNFRGVLDNVRAAARPVAEGITSVVKAVGEGGGSGEIFGNVLRFIGDAAEYASGLLIPIGQVVGGLLSLFADLPAPVQAGALAFLAWQSVPSLLSGLTGGLSGVRGEADGAARSTGVLGRAVGGITAPITGAVGGLRQLTGEMRVQRALARSSGEDISRLGSTMSAVFETSTLGSVAALRSFRDEVRAVRDGAAGAGAPISTLSAAMQTVADRVPAVGAMRDAFVGTTTALDGFGSTAGRVASEATASLGGRLGGAVSSLGDSIARLPATISSAASTLYTGLGVAAINTGEALGRLPGQIRDVASTLSTGLGVAAINAADAVRGIPGAVSSAASTLRTGLGVAAINAADGLRGLASTAREAGSSIGSGLRGGLSSAVDGMRAIPSAAVAAGSAIGTSLRTGLSTAVDAARALPGQIGGAIAAIPGQVGGVFNRLGDGIQGAFVRVGGAIDTGISALGRFATTAAGVGASAFTGLMRAGGSLVSFLGGPWGLALAAAGIGLSLLAQNHAEAEKKARDQQQALDALRGTLDQYSGAVTQATVNEKAKQLAQDGSLAKVKELGISTQDYVRATLGEEGALQRVQAQLTTHTRGLIEASSAYQGSQQELRNLGVSLDDLTAAAQGNGPAMDRINAAIARIPDLDAQKSVESLVTSMISAGGASGKLAADLGISNGKLAEMQTQTRLASEASGDFAAKLDLIKAGLGGLASGAPQTEALRGGLAGVASAAGEAARRAGDAAAQIGGVAAGGAAAAQSMQQSRDAFIAAAQAAGLTADQAKTVADQIGLIPAAARTTFETNASGVTAELNTLKAQFDLVPNAKQIVVQSTSPEVTQQLRDLGIEVTTLPNGQVQIDLHDEAARARFNAFVTTLNTTSAAPTLDLNTATAQQKADAVKSYMDGLVGIATADANAAPGTAKADQLKAHMDGIVGILTADANPAPGTEKANQLQAHMDGLVGILTADANNAPGTAKGDALRAYIDGLLGIMEADANSQPGTAKGDALKAYIDRLRAAITANAETGAANRDIDNAARPRTAVIRVVAQMTPSTASLPGERYAQGAIVSPMAKGGVLGMASGGRLTPMRGGIGRIVPPNTWRVIGDRLRDDEAYIPINRSRRSQAIFEETARRMGYTVARMYADGGFAATNRQLASIAAQRAGGGSSADVVAAIGSLSGRLGAVERSVSITNQFFTESSAKESDMVARVQRRQAAMGLLGG